MKFYKNLYERQLWKKGEDFVYALKDIMSIAKSIIELDSGNRNCKVAYRYFKAQYLKAEKYLNIDREEQEEKINALKESIRVELSIISRHIGSDGIDIDDLTAKKFVEIIQDFIAIEKNVDGTTLIFDSIFNNESCNDILRAVEQA